jgi:putative transposase
MRASQAPIQNVLAMLENQPRQPHNATHRRYAGVIHARRKRTGHFWQGRFGAVAMDENHLAAALR